MTPESKKIINAMSEQIDELCAVIHAIRGAKIANTAPFIARLLKERNELDIARSEALDTIAVMTVKLAKCEHITKHFGRTSKDEISPLKSTTP